MGRYGRRALAAATHCPSSSPTLCHLSTPPCACLHLSHQVYAHISTSLNRLPTMRAPRSICCSTCLSPSDIPSTPSTPPSACLPIRRTPTSPHRSKPSQPSGRSLPPTCSLFLSPPNPPSPLPIYLHLSHQVYAHISSSLKGLPTIRAFAATARFQSQLLAHMAANTAWLYAIVSSARWIGLR